MKTRYYVFAAVFVLVALASSVVLYSSLPERVPMHWNAQGQVNGYGSRLFAALFVPAIMAAMTLLFAALPWLSPRKFEVNGRANGAVYLQVLLVVLGFLAAIHALILTAATGRHLNMNMAITGAVCGLFAVLGAFLPRLRRNFYVGIRTPWTLASEEVWHATHVFAAKWFIAGGIVGLLLTLIIRNFWAPLVVLMLAGGVPIVHSLVYYKRLEHRGQL
ncbi:MAG TPA: DUF1648 domain-containing protein [Terriglobales bacterium]|nr:DUF1648 domain-containing protein [Terriglobales bacterium]